MSKKLKALKEFDCCVCGHMWNEPAFKYEDEIYCWDCLENKLESEGSLNIYTDKIYILDDSMMGSTQEDDMEEIISNIIDCYYDIEILEGDYSE